MPFVASDTVDIIFVSPATRDAAASDLLRIGAQRIYIGEKGLKVTPDQEAYLGSRGYAFSYPNQEKPRELAG